MNNSDQPFPDEITHLKEIDQKLDTALARAYKDVEKIDREYRDAKRYMAEYRGEIDPNEMFQNELLLGQTDHIGTIALDIRDRLAKLKDSPYFARIDFRDGDQPPVPFYIGRFAFNHENQIMIFDWRAPVASMFYDYELGPAGYDAPSGRVNGRLTRKRQFQIKNGVIEYALESSANVQDDILQRELSHTSDEKMKSIISTIQKEQNQIIRDEKSGTLIIQGAAGSGKTSIALHRIAFLLYRFKNQLKAQNIAILSPNRVFGDYISNVIPELGEEPIYELGLPDIAQIQLAGKFSYQPERDPLESAEERWLQRVRFKSTMDFVTLIDQYIERMPETVFSPIDYSYGRFTADSQWIQQRFLAYGKYPVKQRLKMVSEDIFHRFETDNITEEELPKPRAILKSLTSMLKIKNTLALYKNFYRQLGLQELFTMPAKKVLEWADVFPFLYLQAAFEGLKVSRLTKHLVIDEMQDYTPIQYAVINLLFPCQKTILGDFGQLLHPAHSHTLSDLQALYRDAQYVQLNKSYRSTYEIMTFAKGIQKNAALEPVERHGEEPRLLTCKTVQEEVLQIRKTIAAFEKNKNASLGIIVKTNKAAKALYDLLCQEYAVQLITPQSTCFKAGVSITSILMSKGLEFDEVLIPQADQGTYSTKFDRSLLYIACTRAMHRLTLLCTGELSSLVGQIPTCHEQ